MRKVSASELVSLDGVVESPETWHLQYFNDQMAEAIGAAMAASDAMLLGRVTAQLVDSKTFSTGVLYLSYQPAQS